MKHELQVETLWVMEVKLSGRCLAVKHPELWMDGFTFIAHFPINDIFDAI